LLQLALANGNFKLSLNLFLKEFFAAELMALDFNAGWLVLEDAHLVICGLIDELLGKLLNEFVAISIVGWGISLA
jgi:hypothetical protein